MDKRIAMLPGSFDPPTSGHIDIINRACEIFEKVYVVIAVNDAKSYMFTSDERKSMLDDIFCNNNKIEVIVCNGLTVEFAKLYNVGVIIRGLRNVNDFIYESDLGNSYKSSCPELEIMYFAAAPEYKNLSSTDVKNSAFKGSDLYNSVPEIVKHEIVKKVVVC